MTHHTCHFPGCPTVVPPRLFMCKAHWFQITLMTRCRITRAYNEVEHDGEGRCEEVTQEYLAATDAGIAEVRAKVKALDDARASIRKAFAR